MKYLKSIRDKLAGLIFPVGGWYKKQGIIIKLLILLALVIVLGAAGVLGMLHRYYRLSHYVGPQGEMADPQSFLEAAAIPAEDASEEAAFKAGEAAGAPDDAAAFEEAVSAGGDKEASEDKEGTGLSAAEEAALIAEAENAQKNILFPENSAVYNILLIGVDQRKEGGYANSDSMILLSLNKETRRILMISFMRDLYCNIEGVGIRKLNSAHARGGPELLVRTIEDNYKVHIDNYAKVNFYTMIDIVDKVGGITLNITEEELPYVNRYVRNLCGLAGVRAKGHYLDSPGTYLCDGYQTVAYSRIRYVGSDYQRTWRQRTVLTRLIEKARTLNLLDLNALVDTVLPDITHDISEIRMLRLLAGVPAFLTYDIAQSRVPYENLYVSRNEILYPDMEATIARLQEEIYGQSYLVSSVLTAAPEPEEAAGEENASSGKAADPAGEEETASLGEETQKAGTDERAAGTSGEAAQKAGTRKEAADVSWWEQVSGQRAAEASAGGTNDAGQIPVDKERIYVRDAAADGTVIWQPTLRDKEPGSEGLTYPAGGALICEQAKEAAPTEAMENEETHSEMEGAPA